MTCEECIANLKRYKENPVNPTRNGWNFGEALRGLQDKMAEKKFYMNRSLDAITPCCDSKNNDCN